MRTLGKADDLGNIDGQVKQKLPGLARRRTRLDVSTWIVLMVVVGLRAGDGFLASSRLGCMIPFTDGRKARPANAGQMKKVVHRSFDFQWNGYTIERTQRFGRSFGRPRFGGVSILRQEGPKSCAHQGKLRGRKDIHVSAKAIDADQTHLCKHSGDGGAARVVVIEIEIERLLFRRERHDPENFIVEFFNDKYRPREVARAAVLFAAEIFSQRAHPDFAALWECRWPRWIAGQLFLDVVPAVEWVLHMQVGGIIARPA